MIKIVPINFEHIAGYHLALDIVAKEKKYLAWFKPEFDGILYPQKPKNG